MILAAGPLRDAHAQTERLLVFVYSAICSMIVRCGHLIYQRVRIFSIFALLS